MVEGPYPYPTFTHVLVDSGAFPDLQERYRTPARGPPPPVVPPYDFMKTVDERFANGSNYSSHFFLPRDLNNESSYSVDTDASKLDYYSNLGCSGNKVRKDGGRLTSFWRKTLETLRNYAIAVHLLRPVAVTDSGSGGCNNPSDRQC